MSRATTHGRLLVLVLLLTTPSLSHATDYLLQNDGFVAGQNAGFQGGFITGEIGASRFTPPGPGAMQLIEVQFLFGGASGQVSVDLHVWDDAALTTDPGAELFTLPYLLQASDTNMQVIDLSGEGIYVSDTFRVGIEFSQSGYPSIARDDDGSISPTLNFILADGFGWVQSNLLGVTGDWIIRAVVSDGASNYTIGGSVTGLNGTLVLQNNGGDDLVVNADGSFTFPTALPNGSGYDVTVLSAPATQNCVVSMGSGTIAGADVTNVLVSCTDKGGVQELRYDSFESGQTAGFQGGFVPNEIAAVRFFPGGPASLDMVRFLFGGAAGDATIRLHVWNDSAQTDDPGIEIFAQDYLITASDNALQEIDLSLEGIQVSAPFRVGIEFLQSGLPSIARDDDGNIDIGVNFILADGTTWVPSADLGLTGDWILRAVVSSAPSDPAPLLLSVEDIGNDQGGSVRLSFQRSSEDVVGVAQPVLNYEAYRRIDPLPAGAQPSSPTKRLDGWEYVGEVPAHGESIYNMIVPTLADSTVSQGMHWSVFFVRAATALPTVFHDSQPDSGYSLDDLAPSAPQGLLLTGGLLEWDPAPEADFDYHAVYASSSGVLDGGETLLGYTTTNSFSVSGQSGPYYLVSSVDFAGNEGPPAVVQDTVTGTAPPRRGLWARVSPNPFNPATSIRFSIPQAGEVSIRVFDQRGRQVDEVLSARRFTAGEHVVPYRSELHSGVYLLKVISGGSSETVKMSLVR